MTTTQIGIVGLGTMGVGLAKLAALYGHGVRVYDSHHTARSKVRESIERLLTKQVEKGKLTHLDALACLDRIVVCDSLEDLSGCGFVIEAIIEEISAKQKLFGELEKHLLPEAILATNTSSLSINGVFSGCRYRERVIGVHFFNPPQVMPLVEIIPGVLTSEKTTVSARELVEGWGKEVVIASDTPGFIVNRIARPFYGEALRICEEHIADIATIDWAMKEIGGFRMGPFELMDFIGNDINLKVSEGVFAAFGFDPRYKPSLLQRRMVEAGLNGRKSDRGFYDYTVGASAPAPTEDHTLGKAIVMRIVAMLVNEAADALYYKVATRHDIDLAMQRGVNYPKGLLAWGDELGLPVVLKTLSDLFEEYGEDRYRPNVLLKRLAREGRTFYSV